MGQAHHNSPRAIAPIRDGNARRVCALSGIGSLQDRLVSLRSLRDGVEMSLRELENQRRKDEVLAKALLVVRFTRASCDAFLEMAAAASKLVLPKPAAKAAGLVNKLYGTTAPLADAVGTAAAGGHVDVAQTAIASAKKGVSVLTRKQDAGVQVLASSTMLKVEIVNNAMNHDAKGLTRTVASYVRDLNTAAFESAGMKKTAATGELTKIAQTAFTYNEQIGKAFDEMLSLTGENDERYQSLKVTMVTQGRQLSKRIDELERLILSMEEASARSTDVLP